MLNNETIDKELVAGRMYTRFPLNAKIEHLTKYLNSQVGYYLENNKSFDRLFDAFENITLKNSKNTVIRPMLAVKRDESESSVDWIVDYAVDNTDELAYCIKPMVFLEEGVTEYWVLDITGNTLTIFNFKKNGLISTTIDIPRRISVGIYPSLFLKYSEMFQ